MYCRYLFVVNNKVTETTLMDIFPMSLLLPSNRYLLVEREYTNEISHCNTVEINRLNNY